MTKKDNTYEKVSYFIDNFKKIEQFANFEHNWNGYEAEPFDPAVISKAKAFLSSLYPDNPEVFPVATGGIQFEKNYPNGNFFECVIYKDKEPTYLMGNEKVKSENELLDIFKKFFEENNR